MAYKSKNNPEAVSGDVSKDISLMPFHFKFKYLVYRTCAGTHRAITHNQLRTIGYLWCCAVPLCILYLLPLATRSQTDTVACMARVQVNYIATDLECIATSHPFTHCTAPDTIRL